jgi:acetoin utilization protein AcuB
MTTDPHVIGPTMTIAQALQVMRDYKLRHLPVVEDGKLVGLVSDRDLHLVEACAGVNPTEAHVREAMIHPVLQVNHATPLDEVAEQMLGHHAGSVVVADDGRIQGIFTATDALIALAELLKRAAA